MELQSPNNIGDFENVREPVVGISVAQQDEDDFLGCPSASLKQSDDSEDERESISSSISSDSSGSGSEISPTDSSDPSSPVTCVPWVGHHPKSTDGEEGIFSSDTKGEVSSTTATHSDRKRKEHDDEKYCLPEQENKLIRSIEPQQSDELRRRMTISECESKMKNEKRNLSDNVIPALPGFADVKALDSSFQIPTEVDYGIMRSVPASIEPEIQRQWERTAAQWQSRKLRSHRPKHYSRSSKSFSEAEDVIRSNYCNIEELRISPKPSSVSVSHAEACQDSDFHVRHGYTYDPNTRPTLGAANFAPLPQLDLSTLHHQMESDEPISLTSLSSSEQVMLSPRNSITLTEDCAIPPSPPIHQLPMDPPLSRQILDGNQDSKIHQLSRQILNWKKQLKALEKEHAQVFGYKPSHADKVNHREMRKCLIHINKAKQELKQIREDPSMLSSVVSGLKVFLSPISLKELEATVNEIEAILNEDRKIQRRPDDLILMSSAELIHEKGMMQKQLLHLEKRHGRPTNKDEKDVVRKLYERYRVIKKMSSRITTVKENSLDLVPILEHETLDLLSENIDENTRTEVMERKSPRTLRRKFPARTCDVAASLDFSPQNQDYNDMELTELERHYKITSEEKRRLRSALRAIEPQSQGSSSMQKRDEKYSTVESEMMHQKYKHTRATLRLLDVLINKRKYPKLVQEDDKKFED